MEETTGKKAPKFVNRLGSDVHSSPVAAKNQRPYTAGGTSKSAGKYQFSAKQKTPLDVRLHDQFGIDLGNKLFRNDRFEQKIADVQR